MSIEEQFPFMTSGFQYAKDVVAGKIDTAKITKAACKKILNDLVRTEFDEECGFTFEYEEAEKHLRQAQKFCHVKGKNWKSANVIYEPWECLFFGCLFGFMSKKTGRRRFRTAFLELPRGQGKSCIASITGLYMLSLDGELGPEILTASTKKDAARIVFDSSRAMANANPSFLKHTRTEVQQHKIIHTPSNGIMKPLSSDSKSLDGLNPSLIIGDEIHEWTRSLYDVLDSSLSKRDDSLFLMITTAGFSTDSIGYENHCYAEKVILGDVEDDTWLAMIYTIDKEDDWRDIKSWKKANPNWGISVDPVNFEAKAKKAMESPASQPNFQVKHLNIWQNQTAPYFNLEKWDAMKDGTLSFESMAGNYCMVGLDLSHKCDLASIFCNFKIGEEHFLLEKSYIPEARIMDERNVMFKKWVDEGWLHTHKGEVLNFVQIQEELIDVINKNHKVVQMGFDPWSANETGQRLVNAQIDAVEYRMTVQNLSEPMKKWGAMLQSGEGFKHNGSPLLKWCMGNVTAKEDANSNVFPRKDHVRLKIDPVVAGLMSFGLWIADNKERNAYEDHGIRVITMD